MIPLNQIDEEVIMTVFSFNNINEGQSIYDKNVVGSK